MEAGWGWVRANLKVAVARGDRRLADGHELLDLRLAGRALADLAPYLVREPLERRLLAVFATVGPRAIASSTARSPFAASLMAGSSASG